MRRAIYSLIIAALFFFGFSSTRAAEALERSKNPVIVSATVMEHDKVTDILIADGNVVMEQDKMRLSASHAELDNNTGQVKATGSVVYTDKDGNTIFTDKVDFNINTETGVLYNGKFYIKSKKAGAQPALLKPQDQWKDYEEVRMTGGRIEKTGEYTYLVDKGSYSTCTADRPAWKVTGTDINVTVDDVMTARNATFYVKDVPLLYLPYFQFPLERRTGFLIPTLGVNSREGFKMYNRFFWAISDNQDATFGLDYRALKGVELGLDYRYVLGADSKGELKHRYMYDWHEDRNRGTLNYNLTQRFTDSLYGKADLKYQKERNYYREFSDATADRIQRYTESNVFVTQSWSNSTLVGLVQYKYDLTQNNKTTMQRLPEIRYTLNRTRIGDSDSNLYYYFDATATRFYREEGIDGKRIDLYPRISADYDLGRGFILTPRLGFRETLYSRTAQKHKFTTREVLDAGVGLNVKLAKVYKAGGFWGMDLIRHQIEPGLAYDHVPYVSHQRVLPQFDGVDYISERDHLTWSLTNRLTGKYLVNGEPLKQELMVFTLSQSYDVEEAKRQEHGWRNRRPFGNVAGDLSVWVNKYVTLREKVTYDPNKGGLVNYDTDVNVSSGGPWFFVVGHRYTRQSAINFIKASAGYRINKQWSVAGNVWFDQEKTKVREQDFTLSYSGECWGISLHYIEKAGENSPDIIRKRETQYLFTLDLKGLTSVGF